MAVRIFYAVSTVWQSAYKSQLSLRYYHSVVVSIQESIIRCGTTTVWQSAYKSPLFAGVPPHSVAVSIVRVNCLLRYHHSVAVCIQESIVCFGTTTVWQSAYKSQLFAMVPPQCGSQHTKVNCLLRFYLTVWQSAYKS